MTKRVASGDLLTRISAADWNGMQELLADFRGRRGGSAERGRVAALNSANQVILVQNKTGAALDPFSVVGLGDTLYSLDSAMHVESVKTKPIAFKGLVPEYCRHRHSAGTRKTIGDMGRFAITLDGVAVDGFVEAAISGIVPVKVDFEYAGQPYADIYPEDCTKLKAGEFGGAQILDAHIVDEHTGEHWCLVEIGRWWPGPFAVMIDEHIEGEVNELEVMVVEFSDTSMTVETERRVTVRSIIGINDDWYDKIFMVLGTRGGVPILTTQRLPEP